MKELVGGKLKILTRDEIEKIHGATVEVLEKAGIKVWGSRARDLFKEAGAAVDNRTMIVRIREELLLETIRKAPAEFDIYGRDTEHVMHFGRNQVHFGVAGLGVRVQDLDGRIRPSTLKDVADLARLADGCENIQIVLMMVTPTDVPDNVSHLYVILEDWKNCSKTTDGLNYSARTAMETLEMASILRRGRDELVKRPCLLGFTNPVSPLQLSSELTDGAIEYAKFRQPMIYAPEALAGGTAPATIAGLLVQQNAEILAGIMVSELAQPGAPVLYGTVSAAMDMRTGAAALGGPEVGLINIASAQLGRHYNIPLRGTGGNTDSKAVDAQAGAETALNMLMAAMSGMNFIYDACGSMDGSITISYEKLVIDNEIAGMVSRVLEGIHVDEQSLAVDEIMRAGHRANYLSSSFTQRNFRKEHFIPVLMNRKSRDSWSKEGGLDINEAARKEARRILRDHQVKPMDKDVVKALHSYVTRTAKSYA